MRRDLLDPLEWTVAGPCPTKRIVRLRIGAADLVEHFQVVFQARRHAIEVHHLIDGSRHAAFGTRAVVTDDVKDQCVVGSWRIASNNLPHSASVKAR
jgi:hypothetical protein